MAWLFVRGFSSHSQWKEPCNPRSACLLFLAAASRSREECQRSMAHGSQCSIDLWLLCTLSWLTHGILNGCSHIDFFFLGKSKCDLKLSMLEFYVVNIYRIVILQVALARATGGPPFPPTCHWWACGINKPKIIGWDLPRREVGELSSHVARNLRVF